MTLNAQFFINIDKYWFYYLSYEISSMIKEFYDVTSFSIDFQKSS